jgi:hypothetical protein
MTNKKIKCLNLKHGEPLLIRCESGNEYLVQETPSRIPGKTILQTEKQPVEVYKRKKPRWFCDDDVVMLN